MNSNADRRELGGHVGRRVLPQIETGQHDLAEATAIRVACLAEERACTIPIECRSDAMRVPRHRRRKQPAHLGRGWKEPLERATRRIGGPNAPHAGASQHARSNTATLSVREHVWRERL